MPSSHAVVTGIGTGRLVIGAGLFVAPTASVRALGVDAASARRMGFLVRMAAVRDAGLGVGTLVTRGTPQNALWVAVGAAADSVDAIALTAATRHGVTRGVAALASVVLAAAAAGAGAWAAREVRR